MASPNRSSLTPRKGPKGERTRVDGTRFVGVGQIAKRTARSEVDRAVSRENRAKRAYFAMKLRLIVPESVPVPPKVYW